MADISTAQDTYTSRNRRTNYREEPFIPAPASRFDTSIKAAPAPPPKVHPGPFGDLSRAPITEVCRLVKRDVRPSNCPRRLRGLERLLGHLQQHAGDTWQQRWKAAGFDADHAPSVTGLRANRFQDYPSPFRKIHNDRYLDEFFETVEAAKHFRDVHKSKARFDVVAALTTQGIALKDLTPSALLHYSVECRRLGVVPSSTGRTGRFAALGAWQVLHAMEHFPLGTPPTLRAFIYTGQRTVTQLVDRYSISHQGVRQLLIDYLTRRQPEMDYVSLEALSRRLASQFWAKIEKINPGQQDFVIGPDLYDQWRAEIQVWDKHRTKQRMDTSGILLAVRSFYMDLHTWSIGEPEQAVKTCLQNRQRLGGVGSRVGQEHGAGVGGHPVARRSEQLVHR
ncbi:MULTISPECIES: hypothetical protein [Streptomyces]|uniref:hypothetical protein n=1 Tax=Streptomyces TaxID=1883 RepID=UPI0034280BDE